MAREGRLLVALAEVAVLDRVLRRQPVPARRLAERRARLPDGENAGQLLPIFGLHRALKLRRDRLLKVRLPDPGDDTQRAGLVGGAACAWCAEDCLRLACDTEAAAVETNHLLRQYFPKAPT
jgi:hypothetical protein